MDRLLSVQTIRTGWSTTNMLAVQLSSSTCDINIESRERLFHSLTNATFEHEPHQSGILYSSSSVNNLKEAGGKKKSLSE